MTSSCPFLVSSQIHDKMDQLKRIGIDVLEMLEQCPPPIKKTRRHRRQRRLGGGRLTREYVTTAIYVLIVSLAGLALFSENPNKQTVIDGIKAVLNGSCNSLASTVYQAWGLENPVCTHWNSVLALVKKALQGDVGSLGILAGLISSPLMTLKATTKAVNLISDQIMLRISNEQPSLIAIEDTVAPQQLPVIAPPPPPPPSPSPSPSLDRLKPRSPSHSPPPSPQENHPEPPSRSSSYPRVPTLFQQFGQEDRSRSKTTRKRSARNKK